MGNSICEEWRLSTDLIEAAQNVLRRAGLSGRGLLAAVSGGLDSTCLARALDALAKSGEISRLELAHVDHGLRPESPQDAAFCRGLAVELGVPFHTVRFERSDYRAKANLQAEARRLRHAWLNETLRGRGLDAVALAHHADDQAETVVFRLFRGTGPRGVAGMAEWAPPCVRPFLGVRRSRIEETAARQGWPWREDASNLQGKYTRNRIRRELLPLAREIVPGADEAVARFASLCRDDDEFLSVLAHAAFDRMASAEPEGVRLPVQALKALARPILRRVLFAACRFVGGATERLSAEHIESIEGLLEDAEGRAHRRAPVPPGTLFIRSFDDLWVMVPHALKPPPLPILGENAGVGQAPPDALIVGLALDRPRGEILFRHRRPGDRLPEEMGGEKMTAQ